MRQAVPTQWQDVSALADNERALIATRSSRQGCASVLLVIDLCCGSDCCCVILLHLSGLSSCLCLQGLQSRAAFCQQCPQ